MKARFFKIGIIGFLCLFPLSSNNLALGEEEYQFVKMWPELPQPWYFDEPRDVAIDSEGNLLVVDTDLNRIQKFSPDGVFIVKWGSQGLSEGQFQYPRGIATDDYGNIYVADSTNNRIQKFDLEGAFIISWGNRGTKDGEFNEPRGIATDKHGNVYVADTYNNRIQKFGTDGKFLKKWGSEGSGDGAFDHPEAIATDGNANVYVVDTLANRIQKFNSEGNFLVKWGSEGDSTAKFDYPTGIDVDDRGIVYVSDNMNKRIQLFNSEGTFLDLWNCRTGATFKCHQPGGIAVAGDGSAYVAMTYDSFIQKHNSQGTVLEEWGGSSYENSFFNEPNSIALDVEGNIFVADDDNFRIQKFNSMGLFLDKWGTIGFDAGEFFSPSGIAADSGENVYVADSYNNRIQKFDLQGSFLGKWGSEGSEDKQFSCPEKLATDKAGNVYVLDSGNHRVQKFDPNGAFIEKWGKEGSSDGDFVTPSGIAVDSIGNVYVSDTGSSRIKKFTSHGVFISSYGGSVYRFLFPQELAIDDVGNIFVADSGPDCIHVFSSDGSYLYQIGASGSDPGFFNRPEDVAVSQDGLLYVADTGNHRIQVFKKVEKPSKAIIVAGAGATSDMVDSGIRYCAGLSFRNMIRQGYTSDRIFFMIDGVLPELDEADVSEVRDAVPGTDALEYSVTEWAADAGDLVVFMLGHGGDGTFRINTNELLYAEQLDSWLDQAQARIPGNVVVIYDACRSGSFVEKLTAPQGKRRIVATSASKNQAAMFSGNGSLSFSSLFWGRISGGDSFYEAYLHTEKSVATVSETCQSTCIDANGNGVMNEKEDREIAQNVQFGNRVAWLNEVPAIGSVSPSQTVASGDSLLVFADGVVDEDGIALVKAVVAPPGTWDGDSDAMISDLPQIELRHTGNNRYEAVYDQFSDPGRYTFSILAQDNQGTYSMPVVFTVTVEGEPVEGVSVLFFPFARSDGFWETEIAAVNTSDEHDIQGVFTAFDENGNTVGQPMEADLTPFGRTQLLIGQDFQSPETIRYVKFEADRAGVVGYQRPWHGDLLRASAPAACGEDDVLHVSHIASDDTWKTLIALVNTNDQTAALSLEFDNGHVETMTLSPGESRHFFIRDLFGGASRKDIHSAEIRNARGVVGLELFHNDSQMGGISIDGRLADRIFFPHIANGRRWATGLVAYNPDEAACEISITPYTETGVPLATQYFDIAPGGRYFGTAAKLALPDGTAWVRIDSTAPVTGFELFATTDGLQLGGYSGVDLESAEGSLPILEQDGATGIALVNTSGADNNVLLTAHDDQGRTVAANVVALAPFEKYVGVATRVFPSDISNATHMRYSADGPVVVFTINSSQNERMMDALPGMRP